MVLQGAEPVLDRVQPGRVGRGEVEVEAGGGLAPGFHLAVPVGGVVVQDQVHLPGGETPGRRPPTSGTTPLRDRQPEASPPDRVHTATSQPRNGWDDRWG